MKLPITFLILMAFMGSLQAADAARGPLFNVWVSPTLASYHYVKSDLMRAYYKNQIKTIKDLKQQFKQPDDVYVTESNLCSSPGYEWILADDVATERYKELYVICDFAGARKKAIKKRLLPPITEEISAATGLPSSEDGLGGVAGIIGEYALEI